MVEIKIRRIFFFIFQVFTKATESWFHDFKTIGSFVHGQEVSTMEVSDLGTHDFVRRGINKANGGKIKGKFGESIVDHSPGLLFPTTKEHGRLTKEIPEKIQELW